MHRLRDFTAVICGVLSIALTGCGTGNGGGTGGGSGTGGPVPGETTHVMLLISGTANDRFAVFGASIQGLTLTNSSGSTVPLVSTTERAEFIHVNGTAEPFLDVTVPQDTYTSATITIPYGYFTYLFLNTSSQSETVSTDADESNVTVPSTVTLVAPLAIQGSNMVLELTLLAAQSGSYSSQTQPSTYTITPTFTLTPVTLAGAPTNAQNGALQNLNGEVTAVGADSFTVSFPDDSNLFAPANVSFTFNTASTTAFQGLAGFSAISNGMLLNFDAAIQSDGTMTATRVATLDAGAQNVMVGPVIQSAAQSPAVAQPSVSVLGGQQQGVDFTAEPTSFAPFTLPPGATWQVAPQISNTSSLPFNAVFDFNGLFEGQMVAATSGSLSNSGGYITGRTMTLMPQTIDGTVTTVSSSGNFTVYTLQLNPLDTIPALGGPSAVEVYVAPGTVGAGNVTAAVGETLRSTGVIFNDSGTLRMDCTQLNEGVTP